MTILGGDLEVEEIDDVFPNEVNANNHEVTETKLAEDKQSLTRSVEHIHAEPVWYSYNMHSSVT